MDISMKACLLLATSYGANVSEVVIIATCVIKVLIIMLNNLKEILL